MPRLTWLNWSELNWMLNHHGRGKLKKQFSGRKKKHTHAGFAHRFWKTSEAGKTRAVLQMPTQIAPRPATQDRKFEGLRLAAFRLVEFAPIRQWPP